MADFVTTYLQTFVNHEHHILPARSVHFHLKRIKKLLKVLNDPQNSYPVIHIVGTKGKGSTAIFIASILREAGLKVGLYTSPHLYDVKERIRILLPKVAARQRKGLFEGKISSRAFEKLFKTLKRVVGRGKQDPAMRRLTFFEMLTGAAFFFFAQENVDVAVVEAGLGGRLDATNASPSDVCVVTSISLDHTAQLGKNLVSIAREKSGIIKGSTRVVFSADQPPKVLSVIRRAANRHKISVLQVGKDIYYKILEQGFSGTTFVLNIQDQKWPKIMIPLLGSYQVANASLAAGVAFDFLTSKKMEYRNAIRRGLAQAIWPVRHEVLCRKPFVVADGAHNPDSITRVLEAIRIIFPHGRLFVIFGASQDKDIASMLDVLIKKADAVCLTKSRHPRSYDFMQDKERLPLSKGSGAVLFTAPDCRQALKSFLKKAGRQDIILATGSIFVAGEVRRLCKHTA